MPGSQLHVVMYHYVRDLPRTRFPHLKGMLIDDFRAQVDELIARYEMASLETALAFLRGDYRATRDLCLLTFDDGLQEHWATVTPLLAERGVQGLFFIITAALEERRVAAVHMNHFLMATLGFNEYRRAFLCRLRELAPTISPAETLDHARVRRTYRWDEPAVAAFKYLFNFTLATQLRDRIVGELFVEYLGAEADFARELYLTWAQARQMQEAGMLIGGHSHQHLPLARLSDDEQAGDLHACLQSLQQRLRPQSQWPFSYPYGKRDSFNEATIGQLQRAGFTCAFATEVGANAAGADLFAMRRVDGKDLAHGAQ
jgi:peptidoglycan/xylan/chitin deacetylase (PgdA/CDA1 family)